MFLTINAEFLSKAAPNFAGSFAFFLTYEFQSNIIAYIGLIF